MFSNIYNNKTAANKTKLLYRNVLLIVAGVTQQAIPVIHFIKTRILEEIKLKRITSCVSR